MPGKRTDLDGDVDPARELDAVDATGLEADPVAGGAVSGPADDRPAEDRPADDADDDGATDDGATEDEVGPHDREEDGVSALAERGPDHGDAADPYPLDPADHYPVAVPAPGSAPDVESLPPGSWEPAPAGPADGKRASFGRHLEAHYPRLVGQMFAITLDAQEAHDAVQDAYARAWRKWDDIAHDDPTRWVLRVAVSGTTRTWRSLLGRVGLHSQPLPPLDDVSPRTAALIRALYRLSAAERRAVVMFHMAGSTIGEIAALERSSIDKVSGRLSRARLVVTEDMVDVFLDVLGPGVPTTRRV